MERPILLKENGREAGMTTGTRGTLSYSFPWKYRARLRGEEKIVWTAS